MRQKGEWKVHRRSTGKMPRPTRARNKKEIKKEGGGERSGSLSASVNNVKRKKKNREGDGRALSSRRLTLDKEKRAGSSELSLMAFLD